MIIEDELQNVEMAEEEQTKKNNDLKIKRRDYTGYDDEEFTPGSEGLKRSLLAKYDDFLEGPKETVCDFPCQTGGYPDMILPGFPVRQCVNLCPG